MSSKLTDLTELTTPTADDLIYSVDDPAGSPTSKKLPVDNLDDYLSSSTKTLTNKTINSANNTITVTAANVSDFDTEVANNATVASALQPASIGTTVQGYDTALETIKNSTWTRGDIPVTNALNELTDLPIGTAGQVLTSDGTDVSWQDAAGGGGTARVEIFSSDFSTIDQNFVNVVSGTGSLIQYASNELRMLTGTVNTAYVRLKPVAWVQQAGQELNFFDRNPTVTYIGKADGATGGVNGSDAGFMAGNDTTITLGDGVSLNAKGFGFIHHFDSTGTEFYFWCGTGAAGEMSADLAAYITDDKHYEVTMAMTSGTDIKCYINGVLRATLTTNLPSGAYTSAIMSMRAQNATSDPSPSFEMWPKHVSITIDQVE